MPKWMDVSFSKCALGRIVFPFNRDRKDYLFCGHGKWADSDSTSQCKAIIIKYSEPKSYWWSVRFYLLHLIKEIFKRTQYGHNYGCWGYFKLLYSTNLARAAFHKNETLWQQVCPVNNLRTFFLSESWHYIVFGFKGQWCPTNYCVFTQQSLIKLD